MKERVKAVWKDPVWSKVISVAIIGLATYVWAFIEDISFAQVWSNIYNTKISIVYFTISILSIIFLSRIKLKKEPINVPTISKSEQIRKFNKITYEDFKILVRWRVGITVGDIPFVDNVELYCAHHDPPLRLMYDKCLVEGCENSKRTYEKDLVKNDIESRVRHEWDLINEEN